MAAETVRSPLPASWFQRVGRSVLSIAVADRGHLPPNGLEAALLLADDATLRRLNHQFRSIDKATDVLSFPQLEVEKSWPAHRAATAVAASHLGDVAISLERARRQAALYDHSFERELAYLLVHGLLHLVGYNHETDDEQNQMRRLEEAALARLGLQRSEPEP